MHTLSIIVFQADTDRHRPDVPKWIAHRTELRARSILMVSDICHCQLHQAHALTAR